MHPSSLVPVAGFLGPLMVMGSVMTEAGASRLQRQLRERAAGRQAVFVSRMSIILLGGPALVACGMPGTCRIIWSS